MYLNDAPRGGETTFGALGLTLRPTRGMAVVHAPTRVGADGAWTADRRCVHEGRVAVYEKCGRSRRSCCAAVSSALSSAARSVDRSLCDPRRLGRSRWLLATWLWATPVEEEWGEDSIAPLSDDVI